MIIDKRTQKIDLPKWPQMLTAGKSVSIEQAKEIIRRTDSFFLHLSGGNDDDYNNKVFDLLNIPSESHDIQARLEMSDKTRFALLDKILKEQDEWRKQFGVIETHYVNNDWISTFYVCGPAGWCHPTGQIGHTHNVGKWPSPEEIAEDWHLIVSAFPFLETVSTLFDKEYCEEGANPVVTIFVKDGNVTLMDADLKLHEAYPKPKLRYNGTEDDDILCATMEHGVPFGWIEEWAKNARLAVR